MHSQLILETLQSGRSCLHLTRACQIYSRNLCTQLQEALTVGLHRAILPEILRLCTGMSRLVDITKSHLQPLLTLTTQSWWQPCGLPMTGLFQHISHKHSVSSSSSGSISRYLSSNLLPYSCEQSHGSGVHRVLTLGLCICSNNRVCTPCSLTSSINASIARNIRRRHHTDDGCGGARVAKFEGPRSGFANFANEHQVFKNSREFVPHSTFLLPTLRPNLERAKIAKIRSCGQSKQTL